MISAIILAAGQSKRMGQLKMVMPWGNQTIIEHIVLVLLEAGVYSIIVITGRDRMEVMNALNGYSVDFIFNQDYSNGEMLTSVQVGLRNIVNESEAALIVLGDQPQIKSTVVRSILDRYLATHHKIIVPSYKNKRGHPWLVEKTYWKEILDLISPKTLRDFLNDRNAAIDYTSIENSSILQDVDTHDDYVRYKP